MSALDCEVRFLCPALPRLFLRQLHSWRATARRNPNHRPGVRSGARGLSKPAEQTGSSPKHPPTAAAEVSDCKRRCNPQHPSPPNAPGAAAPLHRSLHPGVPASASRGCQLLRAAGHQKALALIRYMQTCQYLQFPQEREFTVMLCISAVQFLLSQTLARDKVKAGGQATPLCQ